MKVIKRKIFSVEECRKAGENTIFVFGDNLIGKGRGGQAVIRYEKNAFGIPTKRLPSMSKDAFFGDREDEIDAVKKAVYRLKELADNNKDLTIVFPEDGLGTGRALMHEKSPKLFKGMNRYLREQFGVDFYIKDEVEGKEASVKTAKTKRNRRSTSP